ncbi:hypothetical protein EUGRSUZ_B00014 [Eucalyptus grandis]|uniref:Uncharacterized protein n=2 Tax=Eucalyptus grandis TaxID=71139 RepID=A0ACC3KJG9_EUCGR|nr:hypothetical protein EUGRSUZ_B00014 [Eucalyptus grandis]
MLLQYHGNLLSCSPPHPHFPQEIQLLIANSCEANLNKHDHDAMAMEHFAAHLRKPYQLICRGFISD